MRTEDLKAQGLTEEQIHFVMAENGKDLKAIQEENANLKTERAQLENDKMILTKEKNEKEKALEELQKNSISNEEYKKKMKEIEDNAKREQEDYIYHDLLTKGLDDAKVLKDEVTREAFMSLINNEKDRLKLSDDKKSLIGLKELTDDYKKKAPHFFEKKKATGYEPIDPDGNRGDEGEEISMASNFAKEANKSDNEEIKSQFFN